jgi:hypothetical protein
MEATGKRHALTALRQIREERSPPLLCANLGNLIDVVKCGDKCCREVRLSGHPRANRLIL